jgi:actin-related protein 3
MEKAALVIDNGTGFTKMGFAGNFEPNYIIPSVIATASKPKTAMMTNQSFRSNELDYFIGQEAYQH